MNVRKEKQFLIFELDDGKTVKQDLSDGTTIGKSGKQVASLCSQLRGYSIAEIITSIENVSYQEYLKYIYRRNNNITNVGTLLKRAGLYKEYEQFFSSGLKISGSIPFSFNEIPKGLIKICKQHELKLEESMVYAYKSYPDIFTYIFSIEYEFISMKDKLRLLTGGYYIHCIVKKEDLNYENNRMKYRNLPSLIKLVWKYGQNLKSLMNYLNYLSGYEGVEPYDGIIELYDYAVIAKKISNKYEKYPKNFLTTHRITVRNYNRLQEIFDEEQFKEKSDYSLEKKIDDIVFIYPKSTKEIKDEASQQCNCVASYIKRVINGECHILFMRKELMPSNSLVTIEVRDHKVVQAKGKFNRDITEYERTIIEKYNKYLDGIKQEAC